MFDTNSSTHHHHVLFLSAFLRLLTDAGRISIANCVGSLIVTVECLHDYSIERREEKKKIELKFKKENGGVM